MRIRRIFKYSKLQYYFYLMVYSRAYEFAFNDIYSWKKLHVLANVHSYFKKGNKYISTYKSQCFNAVFDYICWVIRVGQHMTKKMLS